MALSLKRAFVKSELDKENISKASSRCPPNKRPCLSSSNTGGLLYTRNNSTYESSGDDDSSDEDADHHSTSLKRNNRLRSMRRNYRDMIKNTLSAAPLDSKLSKAVSQYSDDDEEVTDQGETSKISEVPQTGSNFNRKGSISVPSSAAPGLQSPSFDSNSKSRHYLPDSDFTARARCFEYLVGAIDEAWARYCDATSYGEDEVYGYSSGNVFAHTPNSIALSSDDEEGYKSEISTTTNITEYESDYPAEITKPATRRVSEVPANVRLQQLKDRLIKTKYYLQDYVDSDDMNECLLFWKKWDLIKYATIELVEDDDDDETIENTIDELEAGRFPVFVGM